MKESQMWIALIAVGLLFVAFGSHGFMILQDQQYYDGSSPWVDCDKSWTPSGYSYSSSCMKFTSEVTNQSWWAFCPNENAFKYWQDNYLPDRGKTWDAAKAGAWNNLVQSEDPNVVKVGERGKLSVYVASGDEIYICPDVDSMTNYGTSVIQQFSSVPIVSTTTTTTTIRTTTTTQIACLAASGDCTGQNVFQSLIDWMFSLLRSFGFNV